MLTLTENNEFQVAPCRVTFFHLNSQQTHYENSASSWLEFASRWPDLKDLEITTTVLNAEQTTRFDAVKNSLNTVEERQRYLAEIAAYVEFGAVVPETTCPALKALAGTPAATAGVLAQRKAAALTRLATLRYQAETAGTQLPSGATVATTRAHQAQLTSVYTTLKEGFVPSLAFKGPEGFQVGTLETLKPLIQVVAVHVQKTFTAESAVDAQIRAAADLAALDALNVETLFAAALV
jgi:hypothetical protein